ncbi:hypothetical protein Aperf_G00000077535 [Anoplocephala perfoliata]
MLRDSSGLVARKVVVPSRYRTINNKRSCDASSTTRGTVTASSPKRDSNPSFSISDSVASLIPPRKADTSLPAGSVSKQPHFLSDEELIQWSNRTLWRFLALKSRNALRAQTEQEVILRKTIGEKRDTDDWFRKWLETQKSIDLQTEIYKKLIALMEGETGIINLLRHFHDKHLVPVSNRLLLEGITLGDGFLVNLKQAYANQGQARLFLERQQKGLGQISQQMSEIASVIQSATAWTAGENEVVSKLSEASRLVLHLASLHAHRQQLEMLKKI